MLSIQKCDEFNKIIKTFFDLVAVVGIKTFANIWTKDKAMLGSECKILLRVRKVVELV